MRKRTPMRCACGEEGNIIDVNWMMKAEMLQYLIQQGAVDNY